MSESTYVQSQLMHLSRMSVYPTHGRIQVQTANRSLTDGVIQVLYNLQCNSPSLPDYVGVMSMHISTIVNFVWEIAFKYCPYIYLKKCSTNSRLRNCYACNISLRYLLNFYTLEIAYEFQHLYKEFNKIIHQKPILSQYRY